VFRVSDRAAQALLRIFQERGLNPSLGLRIAFPPDPGGAFRYVFRFEAESRPEDLRIAAGPLEILLDPQLAAKLEEVELDYLDDLLNRGFRFRGDPRPGCGSSCGSGSSLEV
jgi:iron-sulfur cluster assembly accessory protein